MKRIGFVLPILFLLPALSPAANKDMIELQRDVAQLQDQMRLLQQSFDTRIGQLQLLTQQALDTANRSNASIADLGRVIQSDNANVGRQVAQPVAALGARVDSLSQDMSGLQSTVASQTESLGRIQQQLVDLKNLLSTMQAPAAPPPAANPISAGSPSGVLPGSTSINPNPPPVSSEQLYQNAKRDMDGGNGELALGEFQDYLNYYRNTNLAPNAQFNIGQIHYSQKKLDIAVKDFDQVLEAFPSNPKTPDAHYMKGRALLQLGQRNEAAKEFKAVLAQFPNSAIAPNCRESLRMLGISPGPPAAPPARKKR